MIATPETAHLQRLLDGRDKFIVDAGLWPDFVNSLSVLPTPSLASGEARFIAKPRRNVDREKFRERVNAEYKNTLTYLADNKRSPLELVMLAAWLNCPVDKLPTMYQTHTCEATMRAWKRVADAAEAYLTERK